VSKARDKLVVEIHRTVPLQRILAAAVWMLHEELGVVAPTVGQIAGYINTLNIHELERLRKVALWLEGSTEASPVPVFKFKEPDEPLQ
jgi:hypothetical protein